MKIKIAQLQMSNTAFKKREEGLDVSVALQQSHPR